jgi:hypothetical protein
LIRKTEFHGARFQGAVKAESCVGEDEAVQAIVDLYQVFCAPPKTVPIGQLKPDVASGPTAMGETRRHVYRLGRNLPIGKKSTDDYAVNHYF